MKYILLVSHGKLAEGMYSVLEMFAGKREDILYTSLENGMSTEMYKANLSDLLSRVSNKDDLIVFADILGGSPLTMALEEIATKNMLENSTVFVGMNVSSCLTATLMKDSVENKEDFIANIISEGHAGLSHYTLEEDGEDEEI